MCIVPTQYYNYTIEIAIILNVASSQKFEDYPLKFDHDDLKERLTRQQFDVTQNKGTERYIYYLIITIY